MSEAQSAHRNEGQWRPKGWFLAALATGALLSFAAVIATGIALTQMFGPRTAATREGYQQESQAMRQRASASPTFKTLPPKWRATLREERDAENHPPAGAEAPSASAANNTYTAEIRMLAADTAYGFWPAAGVRAVDDVRTRALAQRLQDLLDDIDQAAVMHSSRSDDGAAQLARHAAVGVFTSNPSNLAARLSALRLAFTCLVPARRDLIAGVEAEGLAALAGTGHGRGVGVATSVGIQAGKELGRQAWEAAQRPGC